MLWEIVRREILDHITSVRLMLTFVIVIAVMVLAGILFNVKYEQTVTDHSQAVNSNLDDLRRESEESLEKITRLEQAVYTSPNPLQFCAEGGEKDLPNAFKVGYFDLWPPERLKRENFMLSRFTELDWTFVIGVFMSFVALALSYNAMSGEKEDGTLRLMLSNSVPRGTILLGKYVGIMFSALIPLLIGTVLNLIVISFGGKVPLQGTDWLNILMVWGLSGAYVSAFVLLGLMISSLTSRSAISLIVLLSLWVVLAIVAPNMGGLFASEFYRMPTRHEVEQNVGAMYRAISEAAPKEAGNWYWNRTGEVPLYVRHRADMVQKRTAARNKACVRYIDQMIHQVTLATNITRLSPTAVYRYACESVVGIGLPRFRRFYEQVKRYREQLRTFVQEEDRKDTDSYHLIYEWENVMSTKPVDFEAIPKFVERRSSVGESLSGAFLDIVLLVIFNGALFLGAFAAFLRYDVR